MDEEYLAILDRHGPLTDVVFGRLFNLSTHRARKVLEGFYRDGRAKKVVIKVQHRQNGVECRLVGYFNSKRQWLHLRGHEFYSGSRT